MKKKRVIIGVAGGAIIGLSLFFTIAMNGEKQNLLFTPNAQAKKKELTDDQKYLSNHQEEIKEEIFKQLDPERKNLKSLTIVIKTAKDYYDNGGDVGGNYHIEFTVYANEDKNYSLKAELSFPDAGIGPFTFDYPDPYRDKDQDMTKWYLTTEHSEAPEWDWLQQQEDLAQAKEEAEDAKRAEANQKVYQARFQKIQSWVQAHDSGLKKVISSLVAKDKKASATLGEIQTISLDRVEKANDYGSCTLVLHLTFANYPDDIIVLELPLYFENKNYDDVNQRANVSFIHDDRCWFDVLATDSTAAKALNGEFMVRVKETDIWID